MEYNHNNHHDDHDTENTAEQHAEPTPLVSRALGAIASATSEVRGNIADYFKRVNEEPNATTKAAQEAGVVDEAGVVVDQTRWKNRDF